MSSKRHNYPAERKPPRTRVAGRPLTEERKRAFLAVLRESGIVRVAARAASPESDPASGAMNTFRDARKRDSQFAAEWDEAIAEANARIEREAHRRGVEGIPEPVYQRGQRVYETDPETGEKRPAYVVRYSDNLLLRLLERRMPDEWSQHRKIEHSGSVGHGGAVAMLSLGDVEFLSPDQRQALAGILRTIQTARQRQGDETVIVDADWSEVEEDEPTAALPAPDDGEPIATDAQLRAYRDLDPEEARELAALVS